MMLTTRITCIGYLLILVSWAIFDTFVIKQSSIYSVYLLRFMAALLVIVVIAGAAAAFTLRALSMASHAALRHARTVSTAYLIAMFAAIIIMIAIRTEVSQAITFIPIFACIALVSAINILGLSRARKAE